MNSDSNPLSPESPSSGDDLVDALLAEHARLGTAGDEGLLATVRARTIEMPGAVEPLVVAPRATFGVRDWMKVAATVTVSLGLIWLALQVGAGGGPIFEKSRSEDTLRLAVIPQAAPESPVSNPGRMRSPRPSIPRTPGSSAHIAPERAFDPTDLSLSADLLAEFSVSADKTYRQKSDRYLVYEGEVVLKHPDFTLKADRIELTAAKVRGEEKLVGGFVASGDVIEIDRYSAAGDIESAQARQVTYSPKGGALILRGAPSLSSGSSFVVPKSAAGVIVLLQDGFQVIEPAASEAGGKR